MNLNISIQSITGLFYKWQTFASHAELVTHRLDNFVMGMWYLLLVFMLASYHHAMYHSNKYFLPKEVPFVSINAIWSEICGPTFKVEPCSILVVCCSTADLYLLIVSNYISVSSLTC